MKRTTLVASAVALAIGGAVAIGAVSYGPEAFAQAQGAGRGADGRLARIQRMCADGPAHLAAMLAYAEVRLNLRAEQRAGWQELANTVRTAGEPARQQCAQLTALPERGDVAGRLAMSERMMTTGLQAVRAIRPAVERFQATLSPEQREVVAQLMERRGRRGMHGMHGGWGGERGRRGDDRGGPAGSTGTPGGNAPAAPAAPAR